MNKEQTDITTGKQIRHLRTQSGMTQEELAGYRIGDYRLLCLIEDEELVILALSIGHRREVYENT